jgi:hypothetical protein
VEQPINSLITGSVPLPAPNSTFVNVVASLYTVEQATIFEAVAFISAVSVSDVVILDCADFDSFWSLVMMTCEFVCLATGVDFPEGHTEVFVLTPPTADRFEQPIPEDSITGRLSDRCILKFVEKSSHSPFDIARSATGLRPENARRVTGDLIPSFNMAAALFGSALDCPVSGPEAAFSASEELYSENRIMSQWLVNLAAEAGLTAAKLALATRYDLTRRDAMQLLQAAADAQSAEAAWELSTLDSPELFEVAVERGSPAALLEKFRRGQVVFEQLPDELFDNQSFHEELLVILQNFTGDQTPPFYELCLAEAKYWQPVSDGKALKCYRLFEASGRTDFALLRRILLSHQSHPISGTSSSGDDSPTLPADLVRLGDCYASGDLGFAQEPDLAYVNYRNALLGFPNPSGETDRIITTLVRPLLINAQVIKVNDDHLEFIGLLRDDRFPVFRGLATTEPDDLFMILCEIDALGYYRAFLLDPAPDELRAEAEYQIARSTDDQIQKQELM